MNLVINTSIGQALTQSILNKKKPGKKVKRPTPAQPGSDRWFKETEAKFPGLLTIGGPTKQDLDKYPDRDIFAR